MYVPFPTVPDKHGFPSAYRPAAFLDALRAGGWEPGPVPQSVVFTYAHFELYLAAHPETYTRPEWRSAWTISEPPRCCGSCSPPRSRFLPGRRAR